MSDQTQQNQTREDDIYRRRVLYYETDQMGIVHHSNYIRWMEEARIEFLRRKQVSYAAMEQEGVMIPVVSVDCRYRTAARFDENIEIRAEITSFNGVRMKLRYEIRSADSGALVATGGSEHCFIDSKTRKPLNLQRRLPDYYEAILKIMEQSGNKQK